MRRIVFSALLVWLAITSAHAQPCVSDAGPCLNNLQAGTPAITGGTQFSPTITSPTINGTIAGSPTITAPTITSPTITGTVGGSPTITTPTITGPTITGTVAGTPTIASPTISGTVNGSATYNTPTLINPTIVAGTEDISSQTVISTGGTAARTLADRALDPGYSVLDSGAKCDGSTNDRSAINAALTSGHPFVRLPAGTCYVGVGITVPHGVRLSGVWAGWGTQNGSAYVGSILLCDDNTTCVTAGDNDTSSVPEIVDHLIIKGSNTTNPAGVGLLWQGGQGSVFDQIAIAYFAKGAQIGVTDPSSQGTSILRITDLEINSVSDTFMDVIGTFDVRGFGWRFGNVGGGIAGAASYLRFEGKQGSGGGNWGPSDFELTNAQFNVPTSVAVQYVMQFINCVSCSNPGNIPSKFTFSQLHAEGYNTAAIMSDSSYTGISNLSISQWTGGPNPAEPFFALDPNTNIYNWGISNSNIGGCTDVTIAPTHAIDGFSLTSNPSIGCNVSISNSASSASSNVIVTNNNMTQNLTVSGKYAVLAIAGNVVGGSYSNSATGGSITSAVPGNPSYQTDGLTIGSLFSDGEASLLGTVGTANSGIATSRYNAASTTIGAAYLSQATRSGTYGSHGAVALSDVLGSWTTQGDDGTNFTTPVTRILGRVDSAGTVTTNQIPGYLSLRVANASGTLTEYLGINRSGETLIKGQAETVGAGGITANVGGGQSGATLVSADFNVVTTVANSGDSVKLQNAASLTAGQTICETIVNEGSNPLQVFTSAPGTVNGASTGTGVSLPVGATARYCALTGVSPADWRGGYLN